MTCILKDQSLLMVEVGQMILRRPSIHVTLNDTAVLLRGIVSKNFLG